MIGHEKRTICMIGAFPPPVHGQAVAFETLAESPELREKYNVIKIDYAPKKRLNKYLMIPYKLLRNLSMIQSLKKVVRSRKVDIFYLGISSSDQGARRDHIIAKTIDKALEHSKLIIHHHGGNFRTFYDSTDDNHRAMVDYYLERTDCAIVLTPRLRKLFNGLLPESKVKVVSNGISASNKLPEKEINKRIASLSQRDIVHILYLSNMKKTKGYYELLKSAPLLLDNGIDFEMTFAGAFESVADEEEFHNYVNEHRLGQKVKYKGVVTGNEKNCLLGENDIFVLPTAYPNEGQPISILESMAAGMAIVTTDHGGISDVIKDGINGIIITAITPDEIAKAVIRLSSNRDFMAKVCVENMRISNEQYLEQHYVNNMIDIFNEYSE